MDRRLLAADGASRVLAEPQLAETRPHRIEEDQPPDRRFALAEDQLHRLVRLEAADDAGEDAQDAALGAAGDHPGGRRLGVEAAVARPALRPEDGSLPLETEDAAVDVRLAG